MQNTLFVKVFFISIFIVSSNLISQDSHLYNPFKYGEQSFFKNSYLNSNRYLSLTGFNSNFNENYKKSLYLRVLSSAKLNTPGSEKKISSFLEEYSNDFFHENINLKIANYFFSIGRYSYALKWFNKIGENNVNLYERNQFFYNKAYTFFVTKQYEKSKSLFEKLQFIDQFKFESNYYLGYISYLLDDYENALESFNVINNTDQKDELIFLRAKMNFRLGRFEEAAKIGLGNIKNFKGDKYSQMSKIIGESFFNLKDYKSALSFLISYEGKNSKWNNNDFYQLGYTYYSIENYKEAINQFNKIINGDSSLVQNAYFHLANCYLNLNDKQSAINAYRKVLDFNYDSDIYEKSYESYLKLSIEIGNPYENNKDILFEFLKKYPKNIESKNIIKALIDSYVKNQKYQDAIDVIENQRVGNFKKVLTEVMYLNSIKHYNSGVFMNAINSFEKTIKVSTKKNINAKSYFWMGNSYYNLENYDKAIELFLKALDHYNLFFESNYQTIYYHLAYSYFKKKEYLKAIDFFQKFNLNNKVKQKFKIDSYLRLGDSFFAIQKYDLSLNQYLSVLESNSEKKDYALYQISLCYGFLNKIDSKIINLEKLIANYDFSELIDDSLFELAKSFTLKRNYKQSIEKYDQLIMGFDQSPYRPKSMLNKALILYKTSSAEKSSTILKKLILGYPKDNITPQAHRLSMQIAIDNGDVNQYLLWLKSNNINYYSGDDIRSAMFDSAEVLYNSNKKKQAKKSLVEYLIKFPDDQNFIKANFYLSKIFIEEEDFERALEKLMKISNLPSNEYSEEILYNLVTILKKTNRFDEVEKYLLTLERLSQTKSIKSFVNVNLMLFYFKKLSYDKSIFYAQKNLIDELVDVKTKNKSKYILAKSYQNLKNYKKADVFYEELTNSLTDSIAIEALFYKAKRSNEFNDYKQSNKLIEEISTKYKSIPKWSAKSILLMSDNFYKMNDPFQSIFLLETLINNFSDNKTIVNQAKVKLKEIKSIESLNNSSINEN